MLFLVVMSLALVGLWLMRRAARRFAAQQRRLGRWDAKGPLVETEAPHGNRGMNERLEVVSEWHGAILRDRRSEADAADAADAGGPSNASQPPRSEPPRHSEPPGHSGAPPRG
jgi:hypothetical protein